MRMDHWQLGAIREGDWDPRRGNFCQCINKKKENQQTGS